MNPYINLKFPEKIYKIIEECNNHAIRWNKFGTVIIIDIPAFQKEYLDVNKYFKTNKLKSFVRSLNIYGFQKFRKAPKKYRRKYLFYQNKFFRKGEKHLLQLVISQRGKHSRRKNAEKKHQISKTISGNKSRQSNRRVIPPVENSEASMTPMDYKRKFFKDHFSLRMSDNARNNTLSVNEIMSIHSYCRFEAPSQECGNEEDKNSGKGEDKNSGKGEISNQNKPTTPPHDPESKMQSIEMDIKQLQKEILSLVKETSKALNASYSTSDISSSTLDTSPSTSTASLRTTNRTPSTTNTTHGTCNSHVVLSSSCNPASPKPSTGNTTENNKEKEKESDTNRPISNLRNPKPEKHRIQMDFEVMEEDNAPPFLSDLLYDYETHNSVMSSHEKVPSTSICNSGDPKTKSQNEIMKKKEFNEGANERSILMENEQICDDIEELINKKFLDDEKKFNEAWQRSEGFITGMMNYSSASVYSDDSDICILESDDSNMCTFDSEEPDICILDDDESDSIPNSSDGCKIVDNEYLISDVAATEKENLSSLNNIVNLEMVDKTSNMPALQVNTNSPTLQVNSNCGMQKKSNLPISPVTRGFSAPNIITVSAVKSPQHPYWNYSRYKTYAPAFQYNDTI